MIWKNFLIAVLVLSAGGIVFCLFNLWIGTLKTVSTYDLLLGEIQIIAGSMGFVGSDELARCGHRKVRSILLRCLMISLVVLLVVIGIELLFKTWWSSLLFLSASPFWVVLVAPFPVALYLNRNQNKSASQPAGANEP